MTENLLLEEAPGASPEVHFEAIDNRHRCEVRQLLRMRAVGRITVDSYLAQVEKSRGKASRDMLERDAAEQWGRGNRGNQGDWR